MAFLSTFLNMFVHSRIIFLGNAFLSKNTILSTSLSNITFLSVFLSTFLRAFSVERFLSALLSTFLSAFFVEHFFECFFEHYKHNSRYFRTLLTHRVKMSTGVSLSAASFAPRNWFEAKQTVVVWESSSVVLALPKWEPANLYFAHSIFCLFFHIFLL